MDGRGRALENVFVELLWRTVKYEEVNLRDYLSVREVIDSLCASKCRTRVQPLGDNK
jgi:putative transposase